MKACVTGHRPQTLNKLMKYGDFNDIPYMEYNDAVFYTVFKAMKDGFDYFYSGGAIGVDSDWADAVLYTRESHSEFADKNIKLEIAIPCENQDAKWYPKDKEHYAELLEKADKLTYVGKKYTFDCMQKRNEYMVDNSDKVFAFWNGEEKGGTWNTIQYARKQGKDIEIIDLRKICDMSDYEGESFANPTTRDELEKMPLFKLRDYARMIGVERPVSKKVDKLIDEILKIIKGK